MFLAFAITQRIGRNSGRDCLTASYDEPIGLIMSSIAASDLVKTYQTKVIEMRALQGVSFDIEPGAFLAFVGPSRSGKTTLLDFLGCLGEPSSGSLTVAGVDVAGLGRRDAAGPAAGETVDRCGSIVCLAGTMAVLPGTSVKKHPKNFVARPWTIRFGTYPT